MFLEYNFQDGTAGWTSIFADYPAGSEQLMELDYSHESLPAPLNQSEKALKISGKNTSDDLFMGIMKKETGLIPNREYEVVFTLSIASNAPEGSFGVGGSPGSSVYIKAGAVAQQPDRNTDELNWYRLNIDKGNQAAEGEDMINLGTVGIPGDDFVYTLITRSNAHRPISVQASKDGIIWLILGTDSGFESTTTLFYNIIEVRIR